MPPSGAAICAIQGACIARQLAVGRAGLAQDLQRVQRWRGLAVRAAQIGLQRVAEAAVGVAIAAQRLDDRPGGPIGEQHAVSMPVHQTSG